MKLRIGRPMKSKDKPQVCITVSALEKLCGYIEAVEHEISGLGTVNQLGGYFLIEDIFLLPQKAFLAYTELEQGPLAHFIVEWVQAGKDPSDLKLWWHSHANMDVFWSEIDDYTATHFRNGFMLSFVGNRFSDFLLRMDFFSPCNMTLHNLPLYLAVESSEREKYLQEIMHKIDLYQTG